MFKGLQIYIYTGIAVFILSVLGYIGYVFQDRAASKKTIITQMGTIETKKIEVQTTAIAERAKGQIEQVDKEKRNEADTSIGVHSYSF